MLSMQYLQMIVTILVAGEIIFRLSNDIYKTREKQKTRQGLLKLNWAIPSIRNEIEYKLFQKKHILFRYLLDNKFTRILRFIHNPQTKLSIKAFGSIIATVVLIIILSGIILKRLFP
jgi:hypothetical protein